MLSKCFNPDCNTPFRYLREGRIFPLEMTSPTDAMGSGRREYFWLCGHCCTTLTVVIQNGAGKVQPRFLEVPGGETPERSEQEVPFLP